MSDIDIPAPVQVVEANERLADMWGEWVREEYAHGNMDSETAKECIAAASEVGTEAESDRFKWNLSNRIVREAKQEGGC